MIDPTRLAELRELLGALLGDRLSENASVREVHGQGEAFHQTALPDLVAFPETTEEVSAILRACNARGVPVIAFGAGTSLEGGITAPTGGVSVDLARMNRVLAVNAEDLDCVVEAGVTREALNQYLRDTGLFFPIDPGANATLGGMAATRASGTMAVRYGTMKDVILALKVVLSDGTVITTARRAPKSAAGYDLTRLFVGSEGTLGIITEVTLRLSGQPETIATCICPFEEVAAAVQCVIETRQLGIPVARIEFLDAAQIRACNAFSGTGLAAHPTLFVEFHGSPVAVADQLDQFAQIAESHGCLSLDRTADPEERTRLWRARHTAYNAVQALKPGSRVLVTDVCVPISRLADCVVATHADLAHAGLVAPIVGHVGDGNFHVMIPLDPDDHAEVAAVEALNGRLVDRALAMGGTCTGEHGIGLGKREKLLAELGDDAVAAMRAVKRAFDPNNILNPGKIFLPEPVA